MKKKLQTDFQTRQYMVSRDFELYYYNDLHLKKVDLHAHNYYEFYFFLEGDISIQLGSEIYPVQFGDVLLVPPGLSHRPLIASQRIPYRRFVFWISQDYCRHLRELSPDYTYLIDYAQQHSIYLFHNDRVAFNAVQAKLMTLIEEMQADRFGRTAQLSLLANDLILHLSRSLYLQEHPQLQGQDKALYQQLTRYIESHLDEELSLERLAGSFFVSKYHIAHVFKDHLGISIHQYITKKRLALCREAILGGSSITEAFQSFGFGDYSSFYRAFKKEYGISPKDFRDMQIIK